MPSIDVGPVYERLLAYTPRVIVNGREAIELPQSPRCSVLVYLSGDEGDGLLEPADRGQDGSGNHLARRYWHRWRRFVRVAVDHVLQRSGVASHVARDDVSDLSLQWSHISHVVGPESGTTPSERAE